MIILQKAQHNKSALLKRLSFRKERQLNLDSDLTSGAHLFFIYISCLGNRRWYFVGGAEGKGGRMRGSGRWKGEVSKVNPACYPVFVSMDSNQNVTILASRSDRRNASWFLTFWNDVLLIVAFGFCAALILLHITSACNLVDHVFITHHE